MPDNEEVVREERPLFDYKHKNSFKLSQKFKQRFNTQIKGVDTISVDGLVALAHIKGMWKFETEVLQYPNSSNGNMCICKATIGGYDYDPVEDKLIKVEYSDIGDACPNNCTKLVAPSYIRMASTRAQGRALRKYTNIDMVCAEELTDDDVTTESVQDTFAPLVTIEQLTLIKGLVQKKGISQKVFMEMLDKTFHLTDFQMLTQDQAVQFLKILDNYVAPN